MGGERGQRSSQKKKLTDHCLFVHYYSITSSGLIHSSHQAVGSLKARSAAPTCGRLLRAPIKYRMPGSLLCPGWAFQGLPQGRHRRLFDPPIPFLLPYFPSVCFFVCCFLFYIPSVSWIILFLSFSIGLVSLSTMLSEFIRLVKSGTISSFLVVRVLFHCIYVPHLLYLIIHRRQDT